MKKIIFLLCIIMATVKLHAQFIKSTSINAKIGLGITAPYYSSDDVVDNGFFAQGEYILKAASSSPPSLDSTTLVTFKFSFKVDLINSSKSHSMLPLMIKSFSTTLTL